MKRLLAFCAVALYLACLSTPATLGQVDMFGGYSYLRANPGNSNRAENANGWEAALSAKLLGPLGVEADFSNHYGISPGSFYPGTPPAFGSLGFPAAGSYVPGFTGLYGPRLTIRALRRTEPFVHALFGTTHGIGEKTIDIPGIGAACSVLGCPVETINQAQSAFTMAFGGGLNVKVTRHVWIRLIEADYMRAQFAPSPENNLRISAGLVFRYGKW